MTSKGSGFAPGGLGYAALDWSCGSSPLLREPPGPTHPSQASRAAAAVSDLMDTSKQPKYSDSGVTFVNRSSSEDLRSWNVLLFWCVFLHTLLRKYFC